MVLQRRLESMLDSLTLPREAETASVTVEPAPLGPAPHPDPPPLDPLAQTIEATHYRELLPRPDPLRERPGGYPGEAPPDKSAAARAGEPAAAPPDNPAGYTAHSLAGPAGGPAAKPDEPATREPVPPPADSSGRFVAVRPGELDQKPPEQAERPWVSPHTWVLAVGLLAIGLLAYYMLQPPSADSLYRRVQRQTADQSIESIEKAEDDIRQFRDHFAGDPRCQEMDEFVERIETSRLETRLELHAKGMKLQASLSPVERCYIEAMHAADADVDSGIEKFTAIADLFGSRQENSGTDWRCIRLAKRRAEELGRKAESLHKEDIAAVRKCLDRADELAKSDPARAAAIRRGAMELYGEKSWAKDLVERARAELKKP
jgi:hypothetical protein